MKCYKWFLPILINLILITGCSINKKNEEEYLNKPPVVTAEVDRGKVEAQLQKYDWNIKDSSGNMKNEVKVLSDEINVVKDFTPITTVQGEELKIKFTNEPESFEVKMLLPNEIVLSSSENKIIIPKPNAFGKAIFKIDSKWKEGNATYIFGLDIVEK